MTASVKKNFLSFYLNPDLYTEDEAKEELRLDGVDVEEIEKKAEKFLKKINALEKFRQGEAQQKQFEENLSSVKEKMQDRQEANNMYQMAARQLESLPENDKNIFLENIKALNNLKNNNFSS